MSRRKKALGALRNISALTKCVDAFNLTEAKKEEEEKAEKAEKALETGMVNPPITTEEPKIAPVRREMKCSVQAINLDNCEIMPTLKVVEEVKVKPRNIAQKPSPVYQSVEIEIVDQSIEFRKDDARTLPSVQINTIEKPPSAKVSHYEIPTQIANIS